MNLEELYDRYGAKLFHYLTVKLGSREDAEDVLQEVFFRFSRYPVRWRLVRNAEAFAFRVAHNEAVRFLKSRLRQNPPIQTTPRLREVINAEISGPDEEIKHALAAALAGLAEEQREVIILKVFFGLTFKEIASICDLSANTAASRYRYGIARLHSLLEEKA
ncbi:MAG: RNA polymerase sigma factor [Acidobacteriota bacterium]